MTKQELYLTIYQATGNANADGDLNFVTDFHRDVAVHLAYNSGNELSYVTIEFSGVRSRYLSTLLFDGSGDRGVSLLNFAMPKVRLSHLQKALVLLALLDFLTTHGILGVHDEDEFAYYRERISMEYDNGQQTLLHHYAGIKQKAEHYALAHREIAAQNRPSIKPTYQNFVI